MQTKKLNEDQVISYDLYGYLVLEEILDKNECAFALEIFEKNADEKFSALMNLHRVEPLVRELVMLPTIVDPVEQLQRWEVDAVMSQMLFKKASSAYSLQAWNPHQDNSYPQIPYPLNITTNLFLTDADPENGGLYLLPGSQRESLLPFEATISHKEKPGTNPGNTIKIPPQYRKKDLAVKAGSLLIMNSHLIHGSYPNNSPTRSRPLFSVTYVTKGVDVPHGTNAKRERMSVRPYEPKYFYKRD